MGTYVAKSCRKHQQAVTTSQDKNAQTQELPTHPHHACTSKRVSSLSSSLSSSPPLPPSLPPVFPHPPPAVGKIHAPARRGGRDDEDSNFSFFQQKGFVWVIGSGLGSALKWEQGRPWVRASMGRMRPHRYARTRTDPAEINARHHDRVRPGLTERPGMGRRAKFSPPFSPRQGGEEKKKGNGNRRMGRR